MEEQSAQLAPSTAKQKPASSRKAGGTKPRTGKAKLMAFDLDVLAMIQRGENTVDRLLLLTGVDPLQFSGRVEFLCSKNLACRDASNPQVLRLGLKGYDELAKKRRAAERKALSKENKSPAIFPPSAEPAKAPSPAPEPRKAPDASIAESTEEATQTKAPSPAESVDAGVATLSPAVHDQQTQATAKGDPDKDIDLFDLLKRGSPKNGPFKASYRAPLASRQPPQKPLPFEQQVRELGGKEAVREMIEQATQAGSCELCRSPFKLSVRAQENNPKYGYCFCGASYHRDCYESLAHSDEAACVRCGKKLRIQMDRSSEAAFKAIKRLFD